MKLSEILGMLKINAAAYPEREIEAVTCSTDKLRPGCLFAAIRGSRADGHDFIALAASLGAEAAIGDRPPGELEIPENFPYIYTDNSERAYAAACSALCGEPGGRLRLCGVTGTNGKTTVTNMLRSIVLASGQGCGLIGTVETVSGGESRPAERTTPPAEELFPLLDEMAVRGDTFCAMEVSSHALARNRVYGLKFDAGIVTNVTRDHLDFHGTMEAYAEAKARLMEQSRIGVINADDPRADFFKSRSERFVTFGLDNPADFWAENMVFSSEGLSFDSPVGKITLPAGGRFSVSNALASMAAASVMNIGDKYIREGLCGFRGVRGRLELLETVGKYRVYIDYAHTPDGLENVLRALRSFAPGRIITVFGCGGDRDKTKRPLMAEAAERFSDFTVVTSDNPRTEKPMAIIHDIIKGFTGSAYAVIPDRREAIAAALKLAGEGDFVLLAGKGHETCQVVGDKKLHLDEREIVRRAEANMF